MDLSKVMNDDLKKELFDLKKILDPWAAGDYQQVQASKDAIVSKNREELAKMLEML